MKTSKKLFCSLFLLITLSWSGIAFGQGGTAVVNNPMEFLEGGAPETIFKTLAKEDQLRLTLTADFTNILSHKYMKDYQRAELTFTGETQREALAVKIRPRGKYRRKVCNFPPLKIKFDKEGLKNSGIRTKHKSLKLVTHCQETEDADQYLLKEYLIYKMFNQLTDKSFRVKLVEITYVDSNSDAEPEIHYGFLIEDTDEMAERLGGEKCDDCFNMELDKGVVRYGHMMSMFQYMVANCDWKPSMMHNVKVVKQQESDPLLVPYDFDFAGLVNAPYAVPNPDYGQRNIRQRIYLNKVDDLDELKSIIRYFKVNEKTLLQTVKDCKLLTKRNKRDMLNYLGEFFDILDDKDAQSRVFVKGQS